MCCTASMSIFSLHIIISDTLVYRHAPSYRVTVLRSFGMKCHASRMGIGLSLEPGCRQNIDTCDPTTPTISVTDDLVFAASEPVTRRKNRYKTDTYTVNLCRAYTCSQIYLWPRHTIRHCRPILPTTSATMSVLILACVGGGATLSANSYRSSL